MTYEREKKKLARRVGHLVFWLWLGVAFAVLTFYAGPAPDGWRSPLLVLVFVLYAFGLSRSVVRFWSQVGRMKRQADDRRKERG